MCSNTQITDEDSLFGETLRREDAVASPTSPVFSPSMPPPCHPHPFSPISCRLSLPSFSCRPFSPHASMNGCCPIRRLRSSMDSARAAASAAASAPFGGLCAYGSWFLVPSPAQPRKCATPHGWSQMQVTQKITGGKKSESCESVRSAGHRWSRMQSNKKSQARK